MSQMAAGKYFENQVMNASPARMVVMVYDQAIVSLTRVTAAIENGDIEARWRANQNATECIWELLTAVDTDNGGEIAGYLERLYRFMIRRLLDVDLRNDPQPARDVINLLEPLRDSWRELDKQIESKAAGPATASATEPKDGVPVPAPFAVSA